MSPDDALLRFVLQPGIDADERMIRAECTCNFYSQNKLHKGPCEHILATRMQHSRTGRN